MKHDSLRSGCQPGTLSLATVQKPTPAFFWIVNTEDVITRKTYATFPMWRYYFLPCNHEWHDSKLTTILIYSQESPQRNRTQLSLGWVTIHILGIVFSLYSLQWCISPTQNFSMSFQQSRKRSVLIHKNYPFPGAHKYTTQLKYPAAESRGVFPRSLLSCPVFAVSIRNRWSPKTSSVTASSATMLYNL